MRERFSTPQGEMQQGCTQREAVVHVEHVPPASTVRADGQWHEHRGMGRRGTGQPQPHLPWEPGPTSQLEPAVDGRGRQGGDVPRRRPQPSCSCDCRTRSSTMLVTAAGRVSGSQCEAPRRISNR